MSYSLKNSIPAFGGITSSNPLRGNQDLPNLKGIHFSENFRLYTSVNANVNHQDYYNLNQEQPYCQYIINPKIKKLKENYSNKIKAK